jgi:hypothetical protein
MGTKQDVPPTPSPANTRPIANPAKLGTPVCRATPIQKNPARQLRSLCQPTNVDDDSPSAPYRVAHERTAECADTGTGREDGGDKRVGLGREEIGPVWLEVAEHLEELWHLFAARDVPCIVAKARDCQPSTAGCKRYLQKACEGRERAKNDGESW